MAGGHQAAAEVSVLAGGVEMPTVGLAEAVVLTGAAHIDLLKVDTEGAEDEIVSAAPSDLWPRVRRGVVEYHTLAKRHVVATALGRHDFDRWGVPVLGYKHHLGMIYAIPGANRQGRA